MQGDAAHSDQGLNADNVAERYGLAGNITVLPSLRFKSLYERIVSLIVNAHYRPSFFDTGHTNKYGTRATFGRDAMLGDDRFERISMCDNRAVELRIIG